MRIEPNAIFTFYFPYEGHEIAIPVRAGTKEEACQKLLNFFKEWGIEISMEIPKSAPEPKLVDIPITQPDPFVMQLQIEDLVKELMPVKKPKGAQTVDRLVKDWTGFPMESQNFPAILEALKNIKHGKDN